MSNESRPANPQWYNDLDIETASYVAGLLNSGNFDDIALEHAESRNSPILFEHFYDIRDALLPTDTDASIHEQDTAANIGTFLNRVYFGYEPRADLSPAEDIDIADAFLKGALLGDMAFRHLAERNDIVLPEDITPDLIDGYRSILENKYPYRQERGPRAAIVDHGQAQFDDLKLLQVALEVPVRCYISMDGQQLSRFKSGAGYAFSLRQHQIEEAALNGDLIHKTDDAVIDWLEEQF